MKKILLTLFALLAIGAVAPEEAHANPLYYTGFEWASTTDDVEHDFCGTLATVEANDGTMTTSNAVSGTYAHQIDHADGSRAGCGVRFYSASSNNGIWVRAKLRVNTCPSGITTIMVTSSGAAMNSAAVGMLRVDGTCNLEVWEDAASQVGSDYLLSAGSTYCVVLFTNRHDATPNAGGDELRMYVDGVERAGSAAISLAAGIQSARWTIRGLAEGTASGDFTWDDVEILDDQGTALNTIPSCDDKIVMLKPNAAGDSAATAGTFADIDDNIPGPDDDTTKIELDTDGGMTADYNLEAASVAGIDTCDTIVAVNPLIRERAETAAAESWVLRFKTAASGAVYESASRTHDDTTWRTNGDQTLQMAPPTLATSTDPTNGSTITPGELDTSQIGIRTTDGAPDVLVSALQLLVVYRDGGVCGGGGGTPAVDPGIIWFF